ncbi:hypothetical protein AB0P13_24435 [Rhodococcus pyridinivorans]|uniref:hypothetical protein n=1 Tax=Rhodococcus TaxID=1827 RepID=UPI00090354B1|nr:hypothetical protein [Rhodococcus sp. 2G]APE10724.1 hypothetical protein BO226_17225 [Rhodococcus sp. 2G]
MAISLCVLLWAKPGMDEAMTAYEDAVLRLVGDHGGRVVQRAVTDGAVQRSVTDGPDGRPREIQFFTFESQDALDGYMCDERRLALADERDRTVARTEMMDIELR